VQQPGERQLVLVLATHGISITVSLPRELVLAIVAELLRAWLT